MAVKATDQVTVVDMTDIQSVTTYYLLQASTLSAPAQPTVLNPSNWSTTEPTFTSGTTNTLYTCVRTLWGDGSQFSWGTVNVSSSYEAAKAAYNIANNAQNNLDAYIRADDNGIVVGRISGTCRAHMNTDGSFKVEDANGTVLATYGSDAITLGDNSDSSAIKMCNGHLLIKYLLNGTYITTRDSENGRSKSTFLTLSANSAVRPTDNGRCDIALVRTVTDPDVSPVVAYSTIEMTGNYVKMKDDGHDESESTTVSMRKFRNNFVPEVLYNSSTGTNGTVTLAGNAADYERLKIYYKSDDNTYSSVEVYQPDGKRVELSINHCTGTSPSTAGPIWIKGCMVTISGTSITVGTYGNGKIDITASSSVSIATANVIKITRVEGIRN